MRNRCRFPGCGVTATRGAKWCDEHRAAGYKLVNARGMKKRYDELKLQDRPCSHLGCPNTFRGTHNRNYCDKHSKPGRPKKGGNISKRLPLGPREEMAVHLLMRLPPVKVERVWRDWRARKIDFVFNKPEDSYAIRDNR